MKINKKGDWAKLDRLIKRLPKIMSDEQKKTLEKVGLKAERLAVMHIRNQDLNWQGLEESTLKAKERAGHSDKTLVATTDYLNSITNQVKGSTAYAGVHKKATNEDGEEIADIAVVHEFGYSQLNIPERPLWRPVFKETLTWIKDNKMFNDEIIKNMKR